MNIRKRAVVLGVLALIGGRRARAQCDSCRVAILSIGAGPRAVGLGGAYVSGDGPEALFYNPAQVGSDHGSMVAASRVGGATLGQFATTGSIGAFGVGAGVRFLSRSDQIGAGDSAEVTGGGLAAGVTAAREVRGVWLGATANFVSPDLGATGGGAVFDIGAAKRAFGLLFGASAQNLGRDLAIGGVRQELPTRVTVGASLPGRSISTYFDLAASAAIDWERGGVIVPKVGVELTYEPVSGWTFTGRVGAHRAIVRPGELQETPIALGGSFGHNSVSIDYAFQPAVAGGHALQSVGLRIQ